MATCNGNVSHLPLMTAVSVGSGLSKPRLKLFEETQGNPTVQSLEGNRSSPFHPHPFPCAVPHMVIF